VGTPVIKFGNLEGVFGAKGIEVGIPVENLVGELLPADGGRVGVPSIDGKFEGISAVVVVGVRLGKLLGALLALNVKVGELLPSEMWLVGRIVGERLCVGVNDTCIFGYIDDGIVDNGDSELLMLNGLGEADGELKVGKIEISEVGTKTDDGKCVGNSVLMG